MLVLLLLLGVVRSGLVQSACPDRMTIYPCSCLSILQTKKTSFTSVTCHRLPNSASLAAIFPALSQMSIDHFYLYDSFWEVEEGKRETQNLPSDWLNYLKAKEIEIVDTPLSSCFACEASRLCSNSVTTRFTATNSSSHEKICSICKARSGQRFSWVSCMSRLQKFHLRQGKLTSVLEEFFPTPMRQLAEVDLSHNLISTMEASAFKNAPKLKVLILAHNALQKLDKMFNESLPLLEKLDLSFNQLKSLGTPSFFPKMPKLRNLLLDNNFISNLKEAEWSGIGKEIRLIDLRDNALHCDCDIRWINATFAVHVAIQGVCVSPEDYEDSAIRTASRKLNERCDEDGNIGTRPPKY